MTEVQRDLNILVAIAKVDAAINRCRTELALLPGQVDTITKNLLEIEGHEKETAGQLEKMAKERRDLEQKVQGNEEKIRKFRTDLMEVKTNKEYTAVLNEISHCEKDIEANEERLLILMDEMESQEEEHKIYLETTGKKKGELEGQRSQLESRIAEVKRDMEKLDSEKPQVLEELDPSLRKRYDRILAKLHDFAVTHVVDEVCQGCFSRVTPQTSVEVRKNSAIIPCEACGRILVYYNE